MQGAFHGRQELRSLGISALKPNFALGGAHWHLTTSEQAYRIEFNDKLLQNITMYLKYGRENVFNNIQSEKSPYIAIHHPLTSVLLIYAESGPLAPQPTTLAQRAGNPTFSSLQMYKTINICRWENVNKVPN